MFPALYNITTAKVAEYIFLRSILFKMNTGICQYFSLTNALSSHIYRRIRVFATHKESRIAKEMLEKQASLQSTKKWNDIPTFLMPTEQKSANTQPSITETIVHSFKTNYLAAIARGETVSKFL